MQDAQTTAFTYSTLLCSHALASDRLIIEKITCKKPATGISGDAKTAARALFAIIKGGVSVAASQGVAAVVAIPVTVADITQSALDGSKSGIDAINLLDASFSQTDQLFINIDGKKVFPKGRDYVNIDGGESVDPRIVYDFDVGCTIQFVEHDWGSAHDSLGSIVINTKPYQGKDFKVKGAILMSLKEGSIYYVDYRVERNKGSEVDDHWQLCGTSICKRCTKRWCVDSSNSGVDGDTNKNDLIDCPFPSVLRGWKKLDLWWRRDKYLNICSKKDASPTAPPNGCECTAARLDE